MESQDRSPTLAAEACQCRPPRRGLWVFLILLANLAITFGLWFAAFGGIGGYWRATGYDWLVVISGAVMVSQYLALAMWASLCEPRSPFRWVGLMFLASLGAAAMAGALLPATLVAQASNRGGRWALPWGVLFWESYVTFMLVLCGGIVFLLAADIVAWPCRRILGIRFALNREIVATPAARGFGLTELFWWVGMAAAGCWLLRAMLENAQVENVATVLLLLICVLPAALPAAWAVFAARRRWLALLLTLGWAGAYGAALAGVFWLVTSIARTITSPTLIYLLYLPPEMVLTSTFISVLVLFVNSLALSRAGARLTWNPPASRAAMGATVS